MKTTNSGTTWATMNSGLNDPLQSIYFTNENTGYAVGAHGAILKPPILLQIGHFKQVEQPLI